MAPRQKRPPRESPVPNGSASPGRPFLPRWETVRHISRKQWLYLPRLFSQREKIQLAIAAGLALLVFAVLASRLVSQLTVPRPAVGGILREGAVGEPRFLNPLYASGDADRDLVALIFSGLIRYGSSGGVIMDLAEDVKVSPDGKDYTVSLRPRVSWHDGERFSADDVVFTIKTIQDPEYKSPLRPNWQGVSVEKLNDTTVRFSLRQPYAPFLENLSVGILPEHLWRKIPREAAILSDLNLKPVGTGPYQFKKLIHRDSGVVTSVQLARFRDYHGEGPYLKEIRFSFYPDEERLVAAYRRNEVDAFAFVSADRRPALEPLDVEIHELKLPKVFAVFLNPGLRPALARKSVRQALVMAIDRPALLDEAMAGGGRLVHSALPPGSLGFNADITPLPFAPDEAAKLLLADGWKDSDGDGVRERTEGSGRRKSVERLELTLVTSDAPELSEAAHRIAALWNRIGLKTEVKALAVSELETSMIRPRAYEALLFGEVFGHDPDPFAFWHTSQLKDPGLNIALYSNRAVDQLLEEARRTNNPDLRAAKYRTFQKIVSDEIGAIFLYSQINYYAIRRGTEGLNLAAVTLPEERFNEINRWYQDTRRALK